MARIYETFPLICPSCGASLTFIAFLTDPDPIGQDHFDQTPDFDPTQPNPVPVFEFDQSRDG